jgi:hypothetical protein
MFGHSIEDINELEVRTRTHSLSARLRCIDMFAGKLSKCPEGYPRLAALADSDENLMLYRRFGFLQARILLNKQDQLRELEASLDHLDSLDAKNNPSILRSRERDDVKHGVHKKLLTEIEVKFKEYGTPLSPRRSCRCETGSPNSSSNASILQPRISTRLPEHEELLRAQRTTLQRRKLYILQRRSCYTQTRTGEYVVGWRYTQGYSELAFETYSCMLPLSRLGVKPKPANGNAIVDILLPHISLSPLLPPPNVN